MAGLIGEASREALGSFTGAGWVLAWDGFSGEGMVSGGALDVAQARRHLERGEQRLADGAYSELVVLSLAHRCLIRLDL